MFKTFPSISLPEVFEPNPLFHLLVVCPPACTPPFQLRRRLYWVIASVLAAYWAREIASMWLALPYASELAFKMVAVSSVYHVGKILLISVDARRG